MPGELVSAIIPCYNQAHYVQRAIDSVLQQTYRNVEVIVVDDQSPDNLLDVLKKYENDSRVRVHSQLNLGLAGSRNSGTKLARGAYLQYLDSDDWLEPDKFAKQLEVLECEPNVGLVYSDFYMVYPDERGVSTEWSASKAMGPLDGHLFNTLWLNNTLHNATALVRREWMERAGDFNTEPILAEDWEMWLRLAALGCEFRYIPERLAYYRQHVTSMSKDGLQPARREAVRRIIARRFPDRIAEATEFAVETQNQAWQKWVDELQATIRGQQERIEQLERQVYGAPAAITQTMKANARGLKRVAAGAVRTLRTRTQVGRLG